MFKTYLEALTDVGKAKMNILDKSSLLNRKKNWAKVGHGKPDNPLKLIASPSSKQLENYGWTVPEWSRSDEFKPGEKIGFVRGVLHYDGFIKKVVLTIADTSGGNNDIIHDDILDELVRLGRLVPDEDRSNSYDEQTNTFVVVIQNGKLPEFDLSESYLKSIEGNKEIAYMIKEYKKAGGQYKINNHQSQFNTADLMDDADLWEKNDIDLLTEGIEDYINKKEGNIIEYLLKKYPLKGSPWDVKLVMDKRWKEFLSAIYKKFKDQINNSDKLEEAMYDAFYNVENNNKNPKMAKMFFDFKYGEDYVE